MSDNEEKNQSIGTDPKMAQMTELGDKYIKNSDITVVHKYKKLGKDWTWLIEKKKLNFQTGNPQCLRWNINILDRIQNRLDITKEKNSENKT